MTRDEMLRRFEQLLDTALTAETLPAGLAGEMILAPESDADDGERTCDSYALWSAMTTLVQEVRLQGRAFQDLNHTLGAQTEKVAAELRAVWTERERNLQREAERRCRREILSSLIDLRDRLGRGLATARSRPLKTGVAAVEKPGWFARLFGGTKPGPAAVSPVEEALESVIRGYELGIERLDQTLEEFNAREIRCEGALFDPRRMNAIDSEETGDYAEGAVIEVYRSGYEWNGEVFRPAQVKVARARVNRGL
jgi:molecular chaperone GrpE